MENVCQTPGQRLGPATRPKTGMSLVQALDDHDNNPAKGWIQTTVCSSHTVAEEMDTWPSPVLSNFPNDQNNDIQDQEQLLITDIPVESEEVVVLEESVPMETTENNLSNVTKPDSPKQKLQTCCSHVSPMEMSSQEQYTDMHKAIDNTTTATASNIENTPHIKRDSLTPFSEQNVQVQGGGELKQDMVYLIQASNGDSITVVWTGQQFKKFGGDLADLSFSSDEQFSGVGPAAGVAEKAAAQPADNSHMTGGGGGNNQARGSTMLRGNPLGLLMQKRHEMQTGKIYTIQSNLRNTERVERTGHDLLPNGRLWNFTQAPTKRRALHPEMEESSVSAKQDSIEIMDDSSVQETKQQKDSPQKSPGTGEKQSTQEDQPQPFKRSAKKDDETFAVCHNCGYLSQNFDQCERCRKKLPQNPKMHRCVPFPKRKVVYQWKKGTPKITVDKKSFYSSQLTDQMGVYKGLKDNEESTIIGGRRVQVVRAYPKRGRTVGSKLSNVRHQKPSEPETVTISSDEDELNASSSKRQQQSADVSHRSETYNSSTSTTQDSQERSPSPIFPVITSHQSVLPTVSRLERMEDKLGNVISQHGRQKMEVDEVEKKDTEANHAEEPEIQGIHVFVRLLRFGTQRINSRVVTFSTDYITFEIQCEDKSVLIRIYPKEITLCEANLTYRMPVLLLYLTHGCGIRIRAALNMNPNPDSVVAFDPNCRDMTRKLIVIILEPAKVNDSVKGKIMQIFSAYKLVHSELGEDKEIFREITPEEANKKLVEAYPEGCSMYNLLSTSHSLLAHHHSPAAAPASPMQTSVSSSPQQQQEPRAEQEQEAKHKQDTEPEQEHQEKELDREPEADSSPPCAGFVGNVENLLTYPPPPATGGITITNEDLYCLNEGEFLNDVIIDFYLKYLVQERLTEEDRKRTHIFSSFFYKRLTQRLSRYNFSDQEAQASPMRKRHTQVKTWTRHVDIFEKDFVIVPINENAHWFLAIICFPGMERPQSIKYIFINKSAGNPASPDDKMAAAAEAGNIKLPGGTTSLPREDFIELFGCKQPCILIFDSLAGPSRSNVVRTLREYLQVEWDTRKKLPKRVFDKDMIKGGVPKVPQQNNYSDCGVYVLQYVESFFETPIKDFSIPIKLPHWFSEDRVNSKRSEIQELICQLKAESDRKFTS